MPSFPKLSKCRASSVPSVLPRWLSGIRRSSRMDSKGPRADVDADGKRRQPRERRLATCDSETSTGSTSTACSTLRGSMSSNSTMSIPIDEATDVPFDLYHDLMVAAKEAKLRGQHQRVRQGSKARGDSKTTLVATAISCEEMGPL